MTTISLPVLKMNAEIERVVQEKCGQTLQVYAEAEKIRAAWPELNIALEDIIGRMVELSGTYGVAVAFEPNEAKDAMMGTCTPAESQSMCRH